MSNTQSNSSNNTKTVLYYGKEFEVPVGHVYIHTDSRGTVYTSTLECNKSPTIWLFVRGSRGAKVGSFNHTEMSSINWMLSQKRISDLPSVCDGLEQEAHQHADLMLKYAQIAQYSDKPWEEFQFKGFDGTWCNCTHQVRFEIKRQYRLKPQQVQIQVGQIWESSNTLVKFDVVCIEEYPLSDKNYIGLSHTLDVGLSIPYTVTEDTLREHFQLVK